jgi:ADP-heptose:LPS heptosyltransferase
MHSWNNCRKILCVRADNMGDVIMSGPAIRALKKTFGAHITLLTSSAGASICDHMPEIDDVIVNDMPWVKTEVPPSPENIRQVIEDLRNGEFDGAVIFTVYSQSAMPAALVCLMAGIQRRLAYCRENPYHLLTDWVPDKEPYEFIRHQVERDLALVKNIGAEISDNRLILTSSDDDWYRASDVLAKYGIAYDQPFIVAHAGVSERKREFPVEKWVALLTVLRRHVSTAIILTGSKNEMTLTSMIHDAIGDDSIINVAGEFNLAPFVATIFHASMVISVNTATAHIAAAAQVPSLILYAATNPQHSPWKSPSSVLYFPVNDELQSKNPIINYAMKYFPDEAALYPSTDTIVKKAAELLTHSSVSVQTPR